MDYWEENESVYRHLVFPLLWVLTWLGALAVIVMLFGIAMRHAITL
jgi:hypothetical protein